MKPEAQRIAIAEAVDPSNYRPGTGVVIKGEPIWMISGAYPITCPDYLNDLNVCHEMENQMDIHTLAKYRDNLARLFTDHPDDGMAYTFHATAKQKCDAFCKTLNLWTS